ncbi:MAG: hypothetical protein EZS28_036556 [Streblomastix strix]|uniref:Uncharacterized protein n=1 Tax=Streblomastix strix TaxID=222440 RepID=A0A5J4UAP7_9EUKA|nr:MAG: hypothetical protein EZS28_036556 [Streblomastix strix]
MTLVQLRFIQSVTMQAKQRRMIPQIKFQFLLNYNLVIGPEQISVTIINQISQQNYSPYQVGWSHVLERKFPFFAQSYPITSENIGPPSMEIFYNQRKYSKEASEFEIKNQAKQFEKAQGPSVISSIANLEVDQMKLQQLVKRRRGRPSKRIARIQNKKRKDKVFLNLKDRILLAEDAQLMEFKAAAKLWMV